MEAAEQHGSEPRGSAEHPEPEGAAPRDGEEQGEEKEQEKEKEEKEEEEKEKEEKEKEEKEKEEKAKEEKAKEEEAKEEEAKEEEAKEEEEKEKEGKEKEGKEKEEKAKEEKAKEEEEKEEEEKEEEEEGKGEGEGEGERGAEDPAALGEEAEEERRERAALLAEFRALEAEWRRLQQREVRVEPPLGEALRTRSTERRQDGAGGQRRFAQRLRELRELWLRRESEAAERQQRVDARRRDRAESEERAEAAWAAFQARKKAVAVRTLGRRQGGAKAALRAVSDIQARERDKESSVREARLENIKVKLEIRKLESALRARGEAPEGRHAAEISHMKKENGELMEKLRGLCGEVLELKLKVANAQLILDRVTEKLRLVEAENRSRKAELAGIESALLQKRGELSASRKDRDRMRAHCLQLRQQRGLRGEEMLLRDLEEKVNAIGPLSQQLEALKRHHADLVLQQRAVQEKVREANSLLP
ncbi:coiled-coil domain-containing protein 96 [Cyrtonyx montezumae]|uniref:coiled-coil domain-containing protein 96 n=1 Tax=Cyrtonyx montezumae TaxID=9017 RepID=UPI0032D9F7B9